MRKMKFSLPLVLGGLVLAGCNKASALQDVYTNEDLLVKSPWKEYVLPATAIELASGEEDIYKYKTSQKEVIPFFIKMM